MEKLSIDIDVIAKTVGIDKRVVEVYRQLQRYMDSSERTDWKNKRQESWDAVAENKMCSDKDKKAMEKSGQVPLVINKCSKGVQGSAAVVTDSKPDVKFFPVGSGDLYVADLLQRAHNYVWTKNDGQDVIYDGVEEAKIGGISFFRPWFDDSKGVFGRVIFEAVPDPTIVYWSKDSKKRDMSDTDLIIAQKRTKRYILANYDDINEDDMTFGPVTDDSDNKSEGVTGGDNYAEPGRKNDDSGNKDLKNIWEIEAWIAKKEKEFVVIYQLKDDDTPRIIRLNPGKNQSPEESLAVFQDNMGDSLIPGSVQMINRRVENQYKIIIVGKKLISEEKNPFGVDADGDPIPGLIPLKHDRTLSSYPTCPTFKALPINKEKNKRRSQFIYAASMDINAPIIEPAGAKWEGEPGTPGSRIILPKNATVVPQRLGPGSMTVNSFVILENEADRDIDDMYDLPDVLRGKIQPGQENASGRMVLALQDSAGLMSKPFLRKVESSIIKLARASIALILQHWPRWMWERLLEKDEYYKPPADAQNPFEDLEENSDEALEERKKIATKWLEALEKIRPSDEDEEPEISILDIDVRLAVGSSLPTNRMAKASVAIELVKSGIYDPQAALEYVDDPQKDKIAARMKKREREMIQAGIAGIKK